METLTYSNFNTNFSTYFQSAVDEDSRFLITRVRSGTFMFRSRDEGESLTGVRKIVGPISDIKKQMPRIFNAIAGNQDLKRAFVLDGKTAILERHNDHA